MDILLKIKNSSSGPWDFQENEKTAISIKVDIDILIRNEGKTDKEHKTKTCRKLSDI